MTTSSTQSTAQQTIDVEALVDGQPLRRLQGAGMIREWHLTREALAPLFSAGLFGMLFGAPLLGDAGDRFGRKTAPIASMLVFGVATLLSAGLPSLTGIVVLRFIGGFGYLRAGDVLIQRGTNHAWVNRSDRPARVAFIPIDAKPLGFGEPLTGSV